MMRGGEMRMLVGLRSTLLNDPLFPKNFSIIVGDFLYCETREAGVGVPIFLFYSQSENGECIVLCKCINLFIFGTETTVNIYLQVYFWLLLPLPGLI